MPTRAQLEELARAESELVRLARRDVRALKTRVGALAPMDAKVLLMTAWPALVQTYGSVAQALAAEWIEDVLRHPAILGELPGRSELEPTVGYGLDGYFRGDPDWTWSFLSRSLDKFVKAGARRTVMDTSHSAGVRWARVPVGGACAWCRMLGSRGYVYKSAVTAGELDDWHDDCLCQPAPDDGVELEGYDPDALYQEYLDADGDLAKMRKNSGHPH